jgi:hypothetical protein
MPVTKTKPPSETTVARAFATAYLAYIDGDASVASLPDTTAAVRAAARAGGTVAKSKRAGALMLVGLKPATGVRGGVLVSGRNRAGTLYAQETLRETSRGWRVTALLTPDFVQVFVKQSTATPRQPAGSASALRAARAFLAGYLPYYYGHGPATNVRADTRTLARELTAHPSNIPPPMQTLEGQVAGIAMSPAGGGWKALVNVHDGRSTYQLTLRLAPAGGQWAVTEVSAQ